MIQLNNIHYRYPKRKDFGLKGVSFTVEPGEIFTLLGPNGAGKTTLIRILSGLILPQEGTVSVCGHDLQLAEQKARRCLGLVLGDERTFYFRLSGAQNLEFFGGLYGLDRVYLKGRVAEVLGMVGLQNDAALQFMRYSSGMRKRLNMARALLHDPPVLLLDEPTSSVDPESAQSIRKIILDLKRRGRTILLTTHDLTEAERMSDQVGFLKAGQLTKIGTVAECKAIIRKKRLVIGFDTESELSDLDGRAMELLLRRATNVDSVHCSRRQLEINYNGGFDMNAVLAVVSEAGIPITSTQTEQASLEDVFMALAREQ
ncbi:MAG: ABC transporter ATP-binding protein [bacterium]